MAEKSRDEIDRSNRSEQNSAACKDCFTVWTFATSANDMRKFWRNHYRSIEKLAEATVEELDAIHEIGLAVAVSVHNFFQNPRNQEVIERLKAAGVKMEIDGDSTAELDENFNGKTFVLTGKLEQFTRDEAAENNRRQRRQSFIFGQQKNRLRRRRYGCRIKTDKSRIFGRKSFERR